MFSKVVYLLCLPCTLLRVIIILLIINIIENLKMKFLSPVVRLSAQLSKLKETRVKRL